MNSDSLTCQICIEVYDESEREPNVVQGCGHTLCKKCINDMLERDPKKFECPFCKNLIKITKFNKSKFFIKNYALAQLLLEKSGQISQVYAKTCIQHHCPIELLCIDCKCELCYKCAFINFHKGHHVEMMDNFYENIDEKVKEINFWRKKALEHNKMIKNYAQIEEQNLLSVGDMITRQAFEKISVIVNNYFIQTKNLVNNLLEKGKYGFDEFLVKDDDLKELEKKTNNWASSKSLDHAIDLSKVDLSKLMRFVEQHYAQNFTKKLMNEMQEKYFAKLFEEIKTAINDMSTNIAQRATFLPELLKITRYTKKTKDIIIKYEQPKRNDYKTLTKTNFNEILENSKKLIFDLSDSSLDDDIKSQLIYGFRDQNQIRSVSVKCPGAFVNENLWESLRAFPIIFDLKVLTLDLICCKNLGVNDIKSLSGCLRFMKLRKLTLSIMENDALDEQAVLGLANSIGEMNKLISLALCLDRSNTIDDKAFEKLSFMIPKLEFLNHLKISFHSCPNITCIPDRFFHSIKTLRFLNHIELNFASTNVDDKSAYNLIETVCNFKDLIGLELDFTSCNIQRNTVMRLGGLVNNLQKLETFALLIGNSSQITKESLTYLALILRTIKSLKPLRLDINEGAIDHKVIELIPEDETPVPNIRDQEPEEDDPEDESFMSGLDSEIGSEERQMLINNQNPDIFDVPGTLIINSNEVSRDLNPNAFKEEPAPKQNQGNGENSNSKQQGSQSNGNKNGGGKKEEENPPKNLNKKKSKPSFEGVIVLE